MAAASSTRRRTRLARSLTGLLDCLLRTSTQTARTRLARGRSRWLRLQVDQLEPRLLLSIAATTDQAGSLAALHASSFDQVASGSADLNSAGGSKITDKGPAFVPGEILVGFEGDVAAT